MKDGLFDMHGIKCDNKSCDYEDKEVKSTDYLSYLNKPCPKCGSNLLTQADYDAFLKMKRILNHPVIRVINKIGLLFGGKAKTLEVEMNGSGQVSFKEKKS